MIYRSGTSEGLGSGWDVMQVVYRRQDGGHMRIANSFVVARSFDGTVVRLVDPLYNRWEEVSAEDLLGFQKCFDESRHDSGGENYESLQMRAPIHITHKRCSRIEYSESG